MLVAHLVPGYFNAVVSLKTWHTEWTKTQRRFLWCVAFAGTFLPDTDVIVNILFQGIFNHSTLLTHSLLPVLIFAVLWGLSKYILRQPYLSTIWALLSISWLSHLILDAIVHKTPLLYPLSSVMIGYAPERVYVGGFWYYLSDPIFLLEFLLLAIGIGHWLYHRTNDIKAQRLVIYTVAVVWLSSSLAFIWLLPQLQGQLPTI